MGLLSLYQSIAVASPENNEEVTGLLPATSNESSSTSPGASTISSNSSSSSYRRAFSTRARFVSVVSLASLAVALFIVWVGIPSVEERELAADLDIPLLGHAHSVHNAQKLADNFRKSQLENDDILKKTLHKIRKEHLPDNTLEEGCEATVLILRHCEKGRIREHCTYAGFERSVYIASLFGDHGERWPMPSYIFAQGPMGRKNDEKMNFREIETIGPLSDKAGIPVDDSFNSGTINHLSKEILTYLQTGLMCGKVAVISWKHSEIPHLARHLGCGPLQGCPLDYKGRMFDEAWQIKFVYSQSDHSHKKSLKLPKKPAWSVYGSVQAEGFDPLAFSKKAGDYPPGGKSHGGHWEKYEVSLPERKEKSDTGVWEETRVDLSDPADTEASDQYNTTP